MMLIYTLSLYIYATVLKIFFIEGIPLNFGC
jgi:hypothetical protein